MSVLAKSEIVGRLESGEGGVEEIFKDGTWSVDCMRAAGYDLRVAPDYLIVPDGTRYWPDNPSGPTECRAPFELAPREVAFVSSLERLCMPFDLVGNVAQRFTLARHGLLVVCGLLVDPGYGMERREDGSWAPKPNGERLHFQLANIGSEPFTVVPGETRIAGIQFLAVDGTVTVGGEGMAKVEVPSSDALLKAMFVRGGDKPLPPFAFFPEVGELGVDVAKLKKQGANQAIELSSTRRSTEQLVVFGMFLLSITLFTVAVAALIEALASGDATKAAKAVQHADTTGGLSHDGLVVAVILMVLVAVFCLAAIGNGFILIRRGKRDAEGELGA